MSITKKIKMSCAYLGISEAELARRIDTSPQAFSQRMKTGKWSDDDLERIASALGAKLVMEFRFPDGTSI